MEFILLIILIFIALVITDFIMNHIETKHRSSKQAHNKVRSLIDPESSVDDPYLAQYRLEQYRSTKSTYLRSDKWKAKRELVLARDGYCCQLCSSTAQINVHHIAYKNLGDEPLSDLITLCSTCHTLRHEKLGYPQTVEEYMGFYDNLK